MLISHYGQFGLKKGGAIMLTITEIAAGKVKEVMASQNKDNSLLRLYIAGFGWGGPNFGMALDESVNPEDQVDEAFGIKLVADKKFAEYLEGAVVDYIDSEYGGGFQIKTPRDYDCSSGCSGCG